MKKLIAFVSLFAMQATPAMAWVGGPWSNNTHDSHTTGTFGGMMTMKNGSGIFRFTSTETAQLGAFSSSLIYYKGITFFGSCQANIDFEAKKVFGTTNGSAYNRSPAAAQQRSSPVVDNNPSFSPATPTQGGTVTIGNVPLSPNIVDNEVAARNFAIGFSAATGPVGIANSSWQGKITQSAPNIRFKAKGEANFFGAQPAVVRMSVVEAPPVIDNGGSGTAADPLTRIPGNVQQVNIDTGGQDPFPDPANRVKIRVFGSRLSYNVSSSIGGQNGGIDGTGGGGFAF